MRKLWLTLITYCLTTTTLLATGAATLRFDHSKLGFDWTTGAIAYPGAKMVPIGPERAIPGLTRWVRLETGEQVAELVIAMDLAEPIWNSVAPEDIPTSSENRYREIFEAVPSEERLGAQPVWVGDEQVIDGERYLKLTIFPAIQTDNGIRPVEQLTLMINDRILFEEDLLSLEQMPDQDKPIGWSAPLAAGPSMLIVTDARMETAYQQLANYRSCLGTGTEVEMIDDILASYPGRDDAERLRERLKQFYADGGQYVLLGGDETTVPIRYTYHYRTDGELPFEALQQSDLYFADVDGDWNADGDDIWGERFDDEADLGAELRVGRLPFSDSTEVANYIDKLIKYETNPGDGETDWLTRAYFYSSDQMRDYSGGQHNYIAEAYPSWFALDTMNGVESFSGIDPTPNNVEPLETIHELSRGYGIVNIIAHGRGDGFVVKSAEYNDWPKWYLLTEPQNGGHSSTDSLSRNGLTSFYYSLACDNGGFDLERAHDYTSPGFARDLLGKSNAGAVGMVAYSRWGWVGSSHLLQKSFFDTLFAHPEEPAIEAFLKAKEVHYYLRDLVLGQNFLGDPTMRVYTEQPEPVYIELFKQGSLYMAKVSSYGEPVSDARVLLSHDGTVLGEYQTDSQGLVALTDLTDPAELYQIGVIKPGLLTGYVTYAPSIVTDVEDNDQSLPVSFELGQNYPNPFNPSTLIPFSLTNSGRVTLSVFNVLGQEVSRLVDREMPVGRHEVAWDGRDHRGEKVASGVYLYRLTTERSTAVKKMLLLE